jgi:hypothetical protein
METPVGALGPGVELGLIVELVGERAARLEVGAHETVGALERPLRLGVRAQGSASRSPAPHRMRRALRWGGRHRRASRPRDPRPRSREAPRAATSSGPWPRADRALSSKTRPRRRAPASNQAPPSPPSPDGSGRGRSGSRRGVRRGRTGRARQGDRFGPPPDAVQVTGAAIKGTPPASPPPMSGPVLLPPRPQARYHSPFRLFRRAWPRVRRSRTARFLRCRHRRHRVTGLGLGFGQ